MRTITTNSLKPDADGIPPSLVEILGQQSIPYLTPKANEKQAEHAFRPYNTRITVSPLLIAYPTTIPQIQAIVRCVATLGLKISVRSGGHSYAANGLGGGKDGAVVIDLRAWQDVRLEHVGEDREDEWQVT